MKFLSIKSLLVLTSATALASTAPSPLNELVSGVLTRNAAVRQTVADVNVQKITVDVAKQYINGNASTIKDLVATFNSTLASLAAHSVGPSYPAASLPTRLDDAMTTIKNDILATYILPQDINPLLPLEELLQLLGEVGPMIIENAIFLPYYIIVDFIVPVLQGQSPHDTSTSFSTQSIQSPLDSLVSGILASDGAVNKTIAAVLAQTVSIGSAQTPISDSVSKVEKMASSFNTSVASLLASTSVGGLSSSQVTAMADQIQDAVMEMTNDVMSTFSPSSSLSTILQLPSFVQDLTGAANRTLASVLFVPSVMNLMLLPRLIDEYPLTGNIPL